MTSYDFDVIGDTPRPSQATVQKPPAEKHSAEKHPGDKAIAETPAEQPESMKERNEAA